MRWRGEDIYANCQAVPACCQLPNWGVFLVYFLFQIAHFWVDLSEIGAKTLSSQSQISELLFKRYSLQSSEWDGVVDSSMLTVKQLQPAISFITEVFAILNFGIQFIFDSQISHFAIDFDFIVISFLNWSQWDRPKNDIVSLSNKLLLRYC